eukprot:GFUD01045049.1.p1 GENE.GFUD01045049.1~~GFUD01045049.1.p1  ORF type:complete len:195 (+),score=49.19 GFUD01045049.1:90-674(+)
MASRYIARRYGDNSEARSRASSVVRDSSSRATSQVRDNLTFYSRGASAARSRSSTPSSDRAWSCGPSYDTSYNSNQDFYRGKVKSIYERDPLFSDFVASLPTASTTTNMYNAGNLTCLKEQFQNMVQDKWGRKQMEDPSVDHDMALKTRSWSNYLGRGFESASESLGRKHSTARLEKTHFNMPNISVYHKSSKN